MYLLGDLFFRWIFKYGSLLLSLKCFSRGQIHLPLLQIFYGEVLQNDIITRLFHYNLSFLLFRHKSLRENPSHKLVISIALFGILKESKSWVNILNGFYGGPIMGKIGKHLYKPSCIILIYQGNSQLTFMIRFLHCSILNPIQYHFS